MKKHYAVYGLGAALVDTEITLSDADLVAMNVDKGVMTLVDEARQAELIAALDHHLVASKRASGGSAANTTIAASYFGCKSFYSCKVANDENGAFYLADLKAAGVAIPQHITPPAGITGKCLVMITPDAERTMNTFLGISAELSVNELDLAALKESDFVYIEGYLVTSPTGRKAAIQLREQAQQHGTRVALSLSDPAMVQFFRDGLLEMIGNKVDLIFCNRDEVLGFTQSDSFEQACELLKQFADKFAITCGADGAVVFDGEQLHQVSAPKVQAIDTNGAGDMFAGAFLYAVHRGVDFVRATEFANIAAATVVTQYGPRLQAQQYRDLRSQFFADEASM
ncbi:adenosine kinase [Undibacterium macrobrachii]|jgi:sugar/nucleoside kinase (ribokinase family)|uniref:Adenosine kinase n=1 Tax=Undibacterium macrobrachii TaxID=1119058 RepID=A0ABQ2XC37_9BURK|nr:adenosine kinase [Undibacterium macrobrachii]GGX10004.1 adenosine kinase [Undibacterium macrobrachii]